MQQDTALIRFHQTKEAARHGRLAAAALADKAQTAAAFDRKAYAVHRAHDAGQHLKVYVQIVDFENRLRIGHSQTPVATI